jgi:threonine synthase
MKRKCRFSGAQADAVPHRQAFREGRDFVKPVKPNTIAKSIAIGNPADGMYAIGNRPQNQPATLNPSATPKSSKA